jgi:hypothetical protein
MRRVFDGQGLSYRRVSSSLNTGGSWRVTRSLSLALILILLSPLIASHSPLLYGQTTNAALTGQVTDPTKALIVGAKVVAINIGTNVHYEGATNQSGVYYIVALPPGPYRVEVEKMGFKTVIKPGIVLHVQDTLEINFEMALGSTTESITVGAVEGTNQGITVYGEGINMNTTDATVSTTIDRNFAENLPLNGRSFQTLLLLTPGTVLSQGNNYGTFSVNGQRANANSFAVDGVSANVGGFTTAAQAGVSMNGNNPSLTVFGTTQGMTSVDALQEFKIQTSTYGPEFGRQPGGQVSLVTRSGTNDFHGTAFDYLRNDIFDANNWFNDATIDPTTGKNLPKGKERQNDFGGTVGGPIIKDKTFFFFSYEGLRLLVPQTKTSTVPDLCLRGAATCPAGESPAAAAFQPILKSWPIPMGAPFLDGSGNPTGGAPYTLDASQPSNLDAYMIKVDQNLGRLHLFGKYNQTSSQTTALQAVGSPNLVNPEVLDEYSATLGGDIILGPNFANEFRANYTLNRSQVSYKPYYIGGGTSFDVSTLFPAPFSPASSNATLVFFLPGSTFAMLVGDYETNYQRQFNFLDNLSYSTGSHQIKWGVDYRRLTPTIIGSEVGVTYLVFAQNFAQNNDLNRGNITSGQTLVAPTLHPVFANFSAYAQDTWKLSHRLTFTYGLRWDLNPAPTERDGSYPPNIIGLNNPATATYIPWGTAPPFQTAFNNFAPRVGLAYQVRQSRGHETIFRGGFGVFYDLNSEGGLNALTSTGATAPFSNLPFPAAANSVPYPTGSLFAFGNTPPYSGNAIDPNLRLPYTLHWNVSLEQALGQSQSLSLSYVAAAGYRLLRNDTLFNFNPNFGEVIYLHNGSSSNYQALQVQFNRRLSRGLQGLASYTYSHSIDNASDAEALLSPPSNGINLVNPTIDRGNSSFDLRHAFRGAVTYNIPTWKANLFAKNFLGGWSADAIGLAQSGIPDDLIGGFYSIDGYSVQLRPNLVAGQPFYLHGAACTAAYASVGGCPGGVGFNPAAFTPVPTQADGSPAQAQGTLGRNVLFGPSVWQMDFAIHRQFNITERVNLQFRSEFFNIFNHPNFGPEGSFVGQGTFGYSGDTQNDAVGGLSPLYQIGGPRSIQFALKLAF